MKKNPLFSIIVPIYKIENYLEKCIDSIINQTFSDIEIILVNDGSPDSCEDICKKYKEKDFRIKVINKKNGGLVSARKCGAKASSGDYIACIDGDDWISNDYFEEFSKIVHKYKPDMAMCGAIWSYEDKNVIKEVDEPEGYYNRKRIENEIFPILIEGYSGKYFSSSIWGKIFKREIYLKKQFNVDDKIKIGEDHVCVKPIICSAESIYILNKNMYFYRQNPSSMTKVKKELDWDGPQLLGKTFEKQISVDLFDFKDQINRFVVHHLFNVASSQFYRKDSYKKIKDDINMHIEDNYYKDAIKNCKFKYMSKGFFAKLSLKYKFIFLLYLYNILIN